MGRYFFIALTGTLLAGLMLPLFSEAQTATNGVTAHRGNSVERPENTLPAFLLAMEQGADWVETDVYKTRDGRLVLLHDNTTGRTAEKNLDVNKSTYAELAKLDVAFAFRKKHGLSLEQCPPEEIPLLSEVLDLILKEKKSRLSLQPKNDCVDECIAMIHAKGAEKMVGFNDGSLQKMSRVKELAPSIPVFWDRPANCDLTKDIVIAKNKGFEALVPHYSGLTAEKVQQIQSAGLIPGAWTVNEEAVMKELLQWGVKRIYTDNPLLLINVTKRSSRKTLCL